MESQGTSRSFQYSRISDGHALKVGAMKCRTHFLFLSVGGSSVGGSVTYTFKIWSVYFTETSLFSGIWVSAHFLGRSDIQAEGADRFVLLIFYLVFLRKNRRLKTSGEEQGKGAEYGEEKRDFFLHRVTF